MKFRSVEQVHWYLQKWNQEHPNELVIHPSFLDGNWAGYNDFLQIHRLHQHLGYSLLEPASGLTLVELAGFYGENASEKECFRTNVLCLQRSPEFENFRYMLALLLFNRGRPYIKMAEMQAIRETVGRVVKAFEEKEDKEAEDASLGNSNELEEESASL